MKKFTPTLFKYFEGAAKHKDHRAWFEENKALYEEFVKSPFEALLQQLWMQNQSHPAFKGIDLKAKKVCRPLRPANKAIEAGVVKDFVSVDIAEKRTSLFEWNPGIHIQFGVKPDDNFIGMGCYMISTRQRSLIQNRIANDFEEFKAIISARRFKKSWGSLKGERFKRFPRGFEQDQVYSEYLWLKQFYVGQDLSRKEILSAGFFAKAIGDLENCLDLMHWLRSTVGKAKPAKLALR